VSDPVTYTAVLSVAEETVPLVSRLLAAEHGFRTCSLRRGVPGAVCRADDGIDDRRPQLARQGVARACQHEELDTDDGLSSGEAAGHEHDVVCPVVHHQHRHTDRAQIFGEPPGASATAPAPSRVCW
jgi:hypothetical protein